MENNEIYIDGVNVAECPHRKKEVTFMNVIKCYNYGACDGVNCLYKQLKRLEQENKDLKKQIESDKGLITIGGKQQYEYLQRIDELEQENNELKEENITAQKEYLKLEQGNDFLAEKVRLYRSALEEILESAKFAQCLPCGSGNLEDCLNCNDDTTNNGQFCMEKRIHDIKTKCVEVLNG